MTITLTPFWQGALQGALSVAAAVFVLWLIGLWLDSIFNN